MAALGRCPLTKLRRYRDGEKLFEAGDRDSKFFVVKSGEVEIVDDSGEHAEDHRGPRPGEFTGDVAQLTGSPALVSGVARGDCEVYEVSPDALRELLNDHPDLGDLILQAFIARRQLLRESGELHGPARDRLALLAGHLPRPRLPGQEPRAVHLAGPGGRPAGATNCSSSSGVTEADTPVVAWGNKLLLRNPSNRELAEALGLRRPLEQAVYDLVVVGAGPAGLAAAVYGASEGLSTVVLERTAPGGQAGRSMRIENYLGFPTGITGERAGGARRRAGQQVRGAAARRHPGHAPDVRQRATRCSTSTAARRSRPNAC